MLKVISRAVASQGRLLRSFHGSAILGLREITVEKPNEKTTVIDCKFIKSPRKPYLLKIEDKSDKCPLCKLRLNLKHTDVLILSQYIDSEGNILNIKETSLCREQYKLVKDLIYMAQYAGLLPEPPRCKKPYHLLNTYYDETTINLRPKKTKHTVRLHYLEKKLGPIEKIRVNPKEGFYYGPVVN